MTLGYASEASGTERAVRDIKRILLRVPNWIGDAVMCMPALDALKKLYPHARLTVVANKRVAPLFENNPSVADVIVYDPGKALSGLSRRIKFALYLRTLGFDMAVLFQNAFDAAFMTFLAGIPERAGYARDLRGPLLTVPVKPTGEIKKKHQVFYYLNIVEKLGHAGYHGETTAPHVGVTRAEMAKASALLRSMGVEPGLKLIGAAPGASYGPAKRWPPEKFAKTLDRLAKTTGGVVVIFGGKDDITAAREVASLLKTKSLNLAGKLSLRESMATLARASVLVTNDSGLMHVAAAMDVPTVAVFGSTDPTLTGPVGKSVKVVKSDLNCSPCFERRCRPGHYDCLAAVEPEVVSAEAVKLMSERRSERGIVFIDRDGTLNVDTGYINDSTSVALLPGAGEAIRLLKDAGFKVFVVTNQSGVGRGIITEGQLDKVNAKVVELLEKGGATVDGIYICHHLPTDGCGCRKPAPGLAKRAAEEHGLELKGSYVIGDKSADVGLGKNIGARTLLVLTGYGSDVHKKGECSPDFVAGNVLDAAKWIVAHAEKTAALK